jgi:hypothetical protein
MTPEYRARREAKHAAAFANRQVEVAAGIFNNATGTIDLTPRIPKLSFLQGKQFRQGNGGLKNRSGYSLEHAQANRDNLNPYKGNDGKWYFMDDDGTPNERAFVTRDQAAIALEDYRAWLVSSKEVTAEPMLNL